jgi:hypothetical protein
MSSKLPLHYIHVNNRDRRQTKEFKPSNFPISREWHVFKLWDCQSHPNPPYLCLLEIYKEQGTMMTGEFCLLYPDDPLGYGMERQKVTDSYWADCVQKLTVFPCLMSHLEMHGENGVSNHIFLLTNIFLVM